METISNWNARRFTAWNVLRYGMKSSKSLKSLPSLKKKLWKIFSEYIRRREADENGFVACISCGKIDHWKNQDAGHYIPKSLGLSVYFEEKSVHSQCRGCNLFRHGNLSAYAISLRKKYGDGILEELDRIKNTPVKFSKLDYEEMIEKYKGKLNEIPG